MEKNREFMSMEEFSEYASAKILDFLPGEYREAKVDLRKVVKPNIGELTALVVCKNGASVAPSIYLDEYYKKYLDGSTLSGVLFNIAEERQKCEEYGFVMSKEEIHNLTDFSYIKDKLYIESVSVEKNAKLLSSVPHVVMGDIAATYRVEVRKQGDDTMSIRIDHDMLMGYGVSEEALHQAAIINSMKQSPVDFIEMDDFISEMLEGEYHASTPLHILTNEQKEYGASVVFYPGVMEQVAKKFPDGFYAIPSSKHELLLLPKDVMDLEGISEMLRDINDNVVDVQDVLSYKVHEYDPVSKQIFIAGKEPPVMNENKVYKKIL